MGQRLSDIAKTQPLAAYGAFIARFLHKVMYYKIPSREHQHNFDE